jgi:hypothetical protein
MVRQARLTRRRLRRHSSRRRGTQRGGNIPLKIGVLAIFKNEAMVLREWLHHYKEQGFDRAILLNNGSTDNWQPALKGLEGFARVIDAPKKHAQLEHYNTLGLPAVQEEGLDILAILDLDEFLFSRDGRPLRARLEEFFREKSAGRGGPSGFLCPWTMFGSSGHEKQPVSVRKSFLKRKRDAESTPKGVYWVKDLIPGGLHMHFSSVSGSLGSCPDGIQLNHYAIQSKEYFEKVKMPRGDVYTAETEHIRDWNYFKRYDHAEEEDRALADQVITRGRKPL